MPRDLFIEMGQTNANQPRDLFADRGMLPDDKMSPQDMLFAPENFSATGQYFPKEAAQHPLTKALYGTLASSMIPGGGGLLGGLGRVASNIGIGTLSTTPEQSNDMTSELQKNAMINTAFEALPLSMKGISGLAEIINPIKYAGQIADQVRNLAQAGRKEGEKFYQPVHAKYDESMVTPTPKEYLGFQPEDTQYFKPDVNRAYRDFKAEPTFENLHTLQSKMGKYSELYPMRESIKQKIESFLGQDPEMLKSYQTGSKILRDKYYPYVANDTLANIVEHEKPIKTFDPNELSKALKNSPIVDQSKKMAIPMEHPLIDLSKSLQNRLNLGQIAQYSLPIASISTLGHHFGGAPGALEAGGLGTMAGYYMKPALSGIAQNEALVNALKGLRPLYYGGLRSGLGMMNQQ